MSYKEMYYPQTRFGGFTDIDGTMAFYNRVNSLLSSSFTVLDVGCGRGEYADDPVEIRRNLRILKGKVSSVIGIDVDTSASANPFIDDFNLIRGASWPIESNSIDLIISDNVLEHINNAINFFSEARRVLKTDGYICIRTSNRWNYVSVLAKLIPNKYHSKVTDFVQDKRRAEDVFPTLYRCNTLWAVRHFMTASGFESIVYGYEAEPSYLSFSKAAYWLGVVHQRFIPGFLKSAIFAFGKKVPPNKV